MRCERQPDRICLDGTRDRHGSRHTAHFQDLGAIDNARNFCRAFPRRALENLV
jgi:hypothetical protein